MMNLLFLSGSAWHDRKCDKTPLLALVGDDEHSLQPCGMSVLPPPTNLESSEMLHDFKEETRALLIPRGDRISLCALYRFGSTEKQTPGACISKYDVMRFALEFLREPRDDGAHFLLHEGSVAISEKRSISILGVRVPWFSRRLVVHNFGFYGEV